MALAAIQRQGGCEVTGIDAEILYAWWAGLGGAAQTDTIAAVVEGQDGQGGRIRSGRAYIANSGPNGIGISQPAAGTVVYFSTTLNKPITDDDVISVVMGSGDPLGALGPVRNARGVVGQSGRIAVHGDPPADIGEDALPVWRYCIDVGNYLRWFAVDGHTGTGNILTGTEPPEGVGQPTRGAPPAGSAATRNDWTVAHAGGNNPYQFRRGSWVQIGFSAQEPPARIEWINWVPSTSEWHVVVQVVSGQTPRSFDNRTLGLELKISQGTNSITAVLPAELVTGSIVSARFEWVPGDVAAVTAFVQALDTSMSITVQATILRPATQGDGEDGDLHVEDGNRIRARASGAWTDLGSGGEYDLSGGTSVVRILGDDDDEPDAGVGADGDVALKGVPADGVVRIWKRGMFPRREFAKQLPYNFEGIPNGVEVTVTILALNLAKVMPEAATFRATPTDVQPAPPARVPKIAVGRTDLLAEIEPLGQDIDSGQGAGPDIAVEVKRADDADFSAVVEESKALRQVVPGLPRGEMVEARVKTRTNPETTGDAVAVQIGVSAQGLPLPDGYRDLEYEGAGTPYTVWQMLVAGEDGSLSLVYLPASRRHENVEPEFVERGKWVAGEGYSRKDVVSNGVPETIGGDTVLVPRSFIAFVDEEASTIATAPGIGEDWRQVWRPFGEYLRRLGSGLPVLQDPDAEPVATDDPPPETRYRMLMSDIVKQGDGVGGTLGVGEPGEYANVHHSPTGTIRLGRWETMKRHTTMLVVAYEDRLGVDHSHYPPNIQPGDLVVEWYADDRWLAFQIVLARESTDGNGRRFVLETLQGAVSFNEDGGTDDPVDGPMQIRFERAPAVRTPPPASTVPTAPISLVAQHRDDTGPFNDYLELDLDYPGEWSHAEISLYLPTYSRQGTYRVDERVDVRTSDVSLFDGGIVPDQEDPIYGALFNVSRTGNVTAIWSVGLVEYGGQFIINLYISASDNKAYFNLRGGSNVQLSALARDSIGIVLRKDDDTTLLATLLSTDTADPYEMDAAAQAFLSGYAGSLDIVFVNRTHPRIDTANLRLTGVSWPPPAGTSLSERRVGVGANGHIYVPRRYFGYVGEPTDAGFDINTIIDMVSARMVNDDGEGGPRIFQPNILNVP